MKVIFTFLSLLLAFNVYAEDLGKADTRNIPITEFSDLMAHARDRIIVRKRLEDKLNEEYPVCKKQDIGCLSNTRERQKGDQADELILMLGHLTLAEMASYKTGIDLYDNTTPNKQR